MEFITRNSYLERIRPFIDKDIVKVLVGVRRSGKSVLLDQIKTEINSKNSFAINFEDIANEHLTNHQTFYDHFKNVLENVTGKSYLFFDEIQEVQEWERAINSLRATHDVDIYLTGSNSTLLSGELATYIAGRYISFEVFPFSYKEYRLSRPEGSFDEYLNLGGMPFLSSIDYRERPSKEYLESLFDSIIIKDIVKRHSIRDVDQLERLIKYMLKHDGKTFSARSISNYFKSENRSIAPETILNYLKACREAFLIYQFKSQNTSGKKMLRVDEKYYAVDHGFRQAIIGTNLQDIEVILENIVAIELLRRGFSVSVGHSNEYEIDFIAEKDGSRQYFQVCSFLNAEDTLNREVRSLEQVVDNYPKTILYLSSSVRGEQNGIQFVDIEEWLLDGNI